jgi:hypothetical protein
MSATALDIYDAIFQVLSKNIAKAPKNPRNNHIISGPLIRSSDWDWSELDFIFKPLNSFDSSDVRDLECICSSLIFLRKLQPQVREWERLIIL